MNRRLPWIVLLLGAASLVLYFVSQPMGSEVLEVLQAPTRAAAAETDEAPALVGSRVAVTPEDEVVQPVDLEPGESHVQEDAVPGGRVIVLVELALPANSPDSLLRRFEGAPVRTQSWDEQTDVTQAHESRIDSSGVARFEFEEAVHLDWFCLDAPPNSGFAAAYAEMHIDLEPGSVYRHSLLPTTGVPVRGRVELLRGGPVAGVEVGLHLEDSWVKESGQALGEWYPPLFETRTARDGSFVFPAVPPGAWLAAVTPRRYVQIRPDPGGTWVRGCLFVLDEEDHEGRVLSPFQVVPASPLHVQAVDASGRPAEGVVLEFRPLDLHSPELFTKEQWNQERDDREDAGLPQRPDPKEAYEKGDPFGPWPYERETYETDASGEARLGGIPGTWELVVTPRLVDEKLSQRYEVELPSETLRLNIPGTLAKAAGVVLSSAGTPLHYAEVTIRHSEGEAFTTTDRSGEFELAGLSMTGPYELTIAHYEHLPGVWLRNVDAPPGKFRLRAAHGLRVRILDTAGQPVRGNVQIISGTASPEIGPLDEHDARWFDSLANHQRAHSTDRQGRTYLRRLFPGTYRVVLSLPVAVDESSHWGRARTKRERWQEWALETGEDERTVVADLTLYTPPKESAFVQHTGRVSDETTGDPLAGVVVQAHWRGQSRGVRTGKDGEFRIRVPEGESSFLLQKQDYESAEIAPAYFSGATSEHAWILRPLRER